MTTDQDLEDLTNPLASRKDRTPESHPCLRNLSAAFLWRFVPVPRQPSPAPEYAHVPIGDLETSDTALRKWVMLSMWNMAWEAGPMRLGMFDEKDVPPELLWLGDYEDTDFRLVPDGSEHPYAAYSPLYHLLSLRTLHRFRLPVLKGGLWPTSESPEDLRRIRDVSPPDFEDRLSMAVAHTLWPHLQVGRRRGFSDNEPIVILSNRLDYWLPYLDIVAQERMKALGRTTARDDQEQLLLERLKAKNDPRFVPERPLLGGDVWRGEGEVREVIEDLIDCADELGRLRALVDAVKSHRVEDDFSPCWSWAKEDFERKLYRKRSKIKVNFVELRDTIPVHGPDAEVHAELLWQDLIAVCNPRERQVVICLRSGTTRVGDIAKELGYANHSPVSKALARIRAKARKLLEE